MIVLDANVWIAYFHENDTQYKKAQKIFQELSGKILLPEYIIMEIATILGHHAGNDFVNRFFDHIENNNAITIVLTEQTFFLRSISEFRKINMKKFSFIDCSLLLLSESYPVITFDNALHKEIQKRLRK